MTKLDEFLNNVTVVDTETTGVDDTDEIIEFSAMLLTEGVTNLYTSRYKPEKLIPAGASAVHWISDEDVAECLPFESDASLISAMLESVNYIVGHNVEFDRRMLQNNGITGEGINKNKYICTYRIAKKLYSQDMSFDKLSLGYLWFKLELNKSTDRKINPHSAEDDVYMCYLLLKSLVQECYDRKVIDADKPLGEELVRFCNTPLILERMPFGKHKGELFADVPFNYIKWMITNSDALNSDLPVYDEDFAFTIEREYEIRNK